MPVDLRLARQFGANLVKARKHAGISQEDLAFRASLHRTEIGMLERGTRLPRIDTLVKLAGSLDIPPDDLLDGLDWRQGSISYGSFRVIDDEEQQDAGR